LYLVVERLKEKTGILYEVTRTGDGPSRMLRILIGRVLLRSILVVASLVVNSWWIL